MLWLILFILAFVFVSPVRVLVLTLLKYVIHMFLLVLVAGMAWIAYVVVF